MRFGFLLNIGCMSVALGWVAMPGEAKACSPDPCEWTNQFTTFELVSTRLAPDGVVAFVWSRGSSPTLSIEEAMEHVAVEFRDSTGEIVDGSLEWRAFANAIVWQPAEVLTPGDGYALSLVVDNAALLEADADAWESCARDVDLTIPLLVGESLPVTVPVETSVITEHEFSEVADIHHLVCCDDATPMSESVCAFEELWWSEGHCESTLRQGRLTARWELIWSAEPEIVANYVPRFVTEHGTLFGVPGSSSLSSRRTEVICGTFELVALAGGEIVASEDGCFGEDVADQLGLVERDPSSGLMTCMGEPYVCEVVSEDVGWGASRYWDSERCEPYEPGGDDAGDGGDAGDSSDGGDEGGDAGQDGGVADRGCGCASTPPMPASLALWLLAIGLVRRRF
jgi:MYXO-CTERM domain-containing protein